MPHSIAIDSKGRLFVADRSNNRIQIFDQNGTFLDEWTQFGRPSGIAIAKDDTIYVADSESWGPDEPGWKKGIRIGSAREGSVKFFIEDIESTTDEHSGAEGVGVDADGNIFGSVVRRMMLEKHILKRSDSAGPLRFGISFPPGRSAQPLDGRMLLFISDDGRTEPRTQTDQYRANSDAADFRSGRGRPQTGRGRRHRREGRRLAGAELEGHSGRRLLGAGALLAVRNISSRRRPHREDADGPGRRAALGRQAGQFLQQAGEDAPRSGGERRDQNLRRSGNSADRSRRRTPSSSNTSASRTIVSTKFWGCPMHLGAIVLLPLDGTRIPNARYPLLVHHGHFPASMASDGWRETPPDAAANTTAAHATGRRRTSSTRIGTGRAFRG